MLLTLSVPARNERGPQYMEQALAALHHTVTQPFSLEFASQNEEVLLLCHAPDTICRQFACQLYAHYPDAQLTPSNLAPNLAPKSGHEVHTRYLHLDCDLFPIKRYVQFEDSLQRVLADPLAALLLSLQSSRKSDLQVRVAFRFKSLSRNTFHRRSRCLRTLSHSFFRSHPRLASLYLHLACKPRFLRWLAWLLALCTVRHEGAAQEVPLSQSSGRARDREDDLQSAGDKLRRQLFDGTLAVTVMGPPQSLQRTKEKMREVVSSFGTFTGRRARFRACRRRRSLVLSAEELATLWHPPTNIVQAPNLHLLTSRELPPPLELPTPRAQPDMTLLGVTKYRSTWKKFGILPEDRFRHLAFLGKTGMGKSTLLERLTVSDIRAGRGIGLVDPHGDLVEAVLRSVPRHRSNDVVLFDPADRSFPIAFNILSHRNPQERPLIASAVVGAFKKLYSDSWGPRLEHIFRNAVLTLLEVPDASLITLVRLLGNAPYRQRLLRHIENPAVRTFWHEEFARKPQRFQEEAIAPIQNKIGQFISSPILCNILGQSQNKLDLRSVMDDGKILLCNLSKGRIGDDASALLGSFLITGLQLAAMSRADVPEHERRDFFLAVDEFQNYATDSFATILSEARKYRLALALANQYLGQLDEATLHAVFGNVGTLVSFQVGVTDAEILAKQLGGNLDVQDLMTLPKYHAYVRLLLDGEPTVPFSMQTLPFKAATKRRTDTIRRTSRHRYANPVENVEKQIRSAFAPA